MTGEGFPMQESRVARAGILHLVGWLCINGRPWDVRRICYYCEEGSAGSNSNRRAGSHIKSKLRIGLVR